jgi:hypothetical protein
VPENESAGIAQQVLFEQLELQLVVWLQAEQRELLQFEEQELLMLLLLAVVELEQQLQLLLGVRTDWSIR